MRLLFEGLQALPCMQIVLNFENAAPLVALGDRLQIDCIVKTVEQFLISHLSYSNAVTNLIL